MEQETQNTHRGHVSFGKLFLGLLLILGGALYFARAAGLIPSSRGLHWTQLWPVLFILIGFSFLRARTFATIAFGVLLTLFVLGIVVYAMVRGAYEPRYKVMYEMRNELRNLQPCGEFEDDSLFRGWRWPTGEQAR